MPVTPHLLVSTVASLLHMPVSRVKNFDRKLMEAGLRTKKGHGRGSAVMNYADAAMLLVAIASTDEISLAAKCASETFGLSLAEFRFQPTRDQSAMSSLCDRLRGEPRDYARFGNALNAAMRHLVERDYGFDCGFEFEVLTVAGFPMVAKLQLVGKEKAETIQYMGDTERPDGLFVRRWVPVGALSDTANLLAGRPSWRKTESEIELLVKKNQVDRDRKKASD